jgi:hypothetical protein
LAYKNEINNKSLFLFGVLNLLWFLFRTGTKPSRVVYPCQRAALANSSVLLSASIFISLTAVLTKAKRFSSRRWTTFVLLFIVANVISNEQFWAILQPVEAVNPNQEIQLALEPRNATAFPASDIYVVSGRALANISGLMSLMGSHGLLFYKSSTVGVNQGPDGLVARDDVVLIKINEQWDQRGGTNTDVLKELIQAIIDHPDEFVGEIVVADNGQGYGSMNWGRSNAENYTQSTQDVVDTFSPSYSVSTYDWQRIRGVRVDEYSEGDMVDGYILYDTADPETGIYVSYPKFETEFGTYISFKYGVWNGTGYEKRLKVINMPVLKSHWTYSVTACVKHYMGVQSEGDAVSGGLANGHDTVGRGGMGTLMVETGLPTLNIIDAIRINANPPGSTPCGPRTFYDEATRVNLLMASTDPVALDYWAAKNILVQAASLIGYSDTHVHYELAFGRWLNRTKNEIVAGGYNVTTDENHMNVYVRQIPDTAPPIITVLSPENKTYPRNHVFLTFTVNEPTVWMGFTLDGETNVTITGNTNLTDLSEGSHNIIVFANDTFGNMGASHRVYFCTLIRDVAVINVTLEQDWAYHGWTLEVEITVMNKGNISETFMVEAYYDSDLIGGTTVENLPPGDAVIAIILWNTRTVATCTNHTISAVISPVPYELNLEDNQYSDGTVKIRRLGDVNDDGDVDEKDVILAVEAYNSKPGQPRWNLYADFDRDNYISIYDCVTIVGYYDG